MTSINFHWNAHSGSNSFTESTYMCLIFRDREFTELTLTLFSLSYCPSDVIRAPGGGPSPASPGPGWHCAREPHVWVIYFFITLLFPAYCFSVFKQEGHREFACGGRACEGTPAEGRWR